MTHVGDVVDAIQVLLSFLVVHVLSFSSKDLQRILLEKQRHSTSSDGDDGDDDGDDDDGSSRRMVRKGRGIMREVKGSA